MATSLIEFVNVRNWNSLVGVLTRRVIILGTIGDNIAPTYTYPSSSEKNLFQVLIQIHIIG